MLCSDILSSYTVHFVFQSPTQGATLLCLVSLDSSWMYGFADPPYL